MHRAYQYLNTLHLMLCISDIYSYVPIKHGKVLKDFGHFELIGHHDDATITLWKFFISDTIEIDWPQVKKFGQ